MSTGKTRFFIFFSITFFFWLTIFLAIWPYMLVREPDGLYAGWVNIWGDWAIHMSYATSLAIQNTFPPQLSILSGHVLSYPFGVDFISSFLLRLGVGLAPAMLSVSFVLSLLFVCSLFFFFKNFAGSSKTASLATFLFLFNGGLGFFWFFEDFQRMGWQIFANLPREYTHLPDLAGIEWINIVTSEMIPQRGFLLGLPIVLFSLSLFWKLWDKQSANYKKMLLAGILVGFLPVVHMHSLSIMVGFTLWALILTLNPDQNGVNKKTFRLWLYFLVPAIILALFWTTTLYPQLKTGLVTFKPGWLAPDHKDNLVFFWIKNAGVMLILPLVGALSAKKKQATWAIPFWGIFILANLFAFQPFAWDNTKYFTYWWLGASIFAAIFIERLLRKNFVLKILALFLFSVSIFSGALDVLRVTQYEHQKIRMFNNQSLEFAWWIKENTPTDAIFLTADNHDHPIPVLTGRTIIQGFPGWLWTYGVDTDDRKAKMEAVYAGSLDSISYIKELGLDYIVLGPWERDIYKGLNEEYLKENFTPVYQQEDITVFTISP